MDKADRHERRFTKVLDYIASHLDQPLDVARLSQVAHFSPFHFHRQFSAYLGMGVARYILMQRLRRASYWLAFQPRRKITAIALDCGFENPETFSRAFRQALGLSPSEFRRCPDWPDWHLRMTPPVRKGMENMEVKIVTVAPAMVAALEHLGPPERVNDSALRFIEWRKESGLSPVPGSQTYGIAYDDPEATAPERFRFDICGSVSAPVPANAQGVTTKEIPGGRCAVVRHVGSHHDLSEAVWYLYREWLPDSDETPRDFPVYFHYLNLASDTPEHLLQTDVLLPLR
ncbi:AraC family transcriptional regulator [Chromobacterium phragmitis]|uniref:AraC family transcriptional regulator n=1 Tax=Chromobacterium phragmitis TaxID=2202141 RepID=A0A344UKC6_9NEIS|nr:AraC family transcriptional regulator [Chromobacterium phragmitis]AXE30330.1 AraC family transcriptional regulator [Chromobacterium phragmitis]AXE35724.1 AraC family transcriptional regulator [Chromobacterium phragmitis]